MISTNMCDENNDEYVRTMNENSVKPNIVFKLSNDLFLPTYFEEDTPIDIIKAFVSGDHSLKDVKFTIQKRQNIDQNKFNKYGCIYHENNSPNTTEASLSSFKEETEQNFDNSNYEYMEYIEPQNINSESNILQQNDQQLIENDDVIEQYSNPSLPIDISLDKQKENAQKSYHKEKQQANLPLSNEKPKVRTDKTENSFYPKEEASKHHGSRPSSKLKPTPTSIPPKDTKKSNKMPRSSTDQTNAEGKYTLSTTRSSPQTLAGSQSTRPKSRNKKDHDLIPRSLTDQTNVKEKSKETLRTTKSSPQTSAGSQNTRPKSRNKKDHDSIPRSSTDQTNVKDKGKETLSTTKSSPQPTTNLQTRKNSANNDYKSMNTVIKINDPQPIIIKPKVESNNKNKNKLQKEQPINQNIKGKADYRIKKRKSEENLEESPDILKIDEDIENVQNDGDFASLVTASSHKSSDFLQPQNNEEEELYHIYYPNEEKSRPRKEANEIEAIKSEEPADDSKSRKENKKLKKTQSINDEQNSRKVADTAKPNKEEQDPIKTSKETKLSKKPKQPNIELQHDKNLKESVNPIENPIPIRQPEEEFDQANIHESRIKRSSSKKRVNERIPVDLEKVNTMADLVSNYNFEEGDVILIEYEKRVDSKSSKSDEPSPANTDVISYVTFTPFVYDENGECKEYDKEKVPVGLLQNKTIRSIRNQLDIQFKSGKPITPFTHKFKQSASKSSRPSRFIPGVVKEGEEDNKEYATILFSSDCKIINDNEYVLYKGKNELKPVKFDARFSSIFLIYIKNDLLNIDKIALSLDPKSARLFEKPKVETNEIKILDLYSKKEITSISVSDCDLNTFKVGELYELTQNAIHKEIDDFSLFAERNETTVFLFDNDEIVQSIINETGESLFFYMEVLNKKDMMPRMLRNFKNMAKGELDDIQLNKIFIHSGRSSDITISTIQFYT